MRCYLFLAGQHDPEHQWVGYVPHKGEIVRKTDGSQWIVRTVILAWDTRGEFLWIEAAKLSQWTQPVHPDDFPDIDAWNQPDPAMDLLGRIMAVIDGGEDDWCCERPDSRYPHAANCLLDETRRLLIAAGHGGE